MNFTTKLGIQGNNLTLVEYSTRVHPLRYRNATLFVIFILNNSQSVRMQCNAMQYNTMQCISEVLNDLWFVRQKVLKVS